MAAEINKAVERLTEQFGAEVEAILKASLDDRKMAVVCIMNLFSREVATLTRERDEARAICCEVAALQSEDGGRSFPSKELCDRAATLSRQSKEGGE